MTDSGEANEPGVLWHYTDAAGLFGILSSRQFRFSDAMFLNDRTERVYGREFIQSVLAELEANDQTGMIHEVREELAFRTADRVYILSMSESNNSIGQWERYGARGEGYCIGFDTGQLDSVLDPDQVPRVAMIYKADEQRQLVIEAATGAAEMYGQFRSATQESEKHGVFTALPAPGDLGMLVFRLKNPDFHEEREWRYFVDAYDWADDQSPEEDVAVRGNYLKPYIELPRRSKHRPLPPLPVTTIVCGPKLDGELARPGVERLLRVHGYQDISVELSPLAKSWR